MARLSRKKLRMNKIKIDITPGYDHLRPFIESIPVRFEGEGTYIYGGKRNLIKSFEAPDGTMLNIKRYHQPAFFNRLIYSWGIRKPKGQRAFEYPTILLAKGIETPQPVAYIEERSMGLLRLSYFISMQCDYPHRLYELGDATAELYEPVAAALAHYAAHMHNQEILHLDFSPGNILWENTADQYRFSIVDINRMQFGPVSMEQGCKSFARLWGPKRFIQLLVREYARLRHFDEKKAEALTMKAREKFWTRYQKKREVEFKLEL